MSEKWYNRFVKHVDEESTSSGNRYCQRASALGCERGCRGRGKFRFGVVRLKSRGMVGGNGSPRYG